jgi:hypothetical protein
LNVQNWIKIIKFNSNSIWIHIIRVETLQ